MQFIRHILRKSLSEKIISRYEKKLELNEQDKRKVIRNVAKYMVKALKGKHPSPNQKRRTANAIKRLFPLVYPDIEVLIGSNSRSGKLGFAFNNMVNEYERKNHDSSSDEESVDMDEASVEPQETEETDETDVDEEVEVDEQAMDEQEEENEAITFLRSAVLTASSRPVIIRYFDETRELRHAEAMEGSSKYFFDLYKQDPRFIASEFDAQYPEKGDKLGDELEKFSRFTEDLGRQTKRNFKLVTITNEETKPFQKLIVLLGRPAAGGAGEASTSLVKTIHGQATVNEICEICHQQNFPFVIIRESRPPQYVINMDGLPIFLNPNHFSTFATAFDLLFKLFFVFHLDYPQALEQSNRTKNS